MAYCDGHSSDGDRWAAGSARAAPRPPVALGPGAALAALVLSVTLGYPAAGQGPQLAGATQDILACSANASGAEAGPDYEAVRKGLGATLASLAELRKEKRTEQVAGATPNAGLAAEEIGVIQASLASTLLAVGQLKRGHSGGPQTAMAELGVSAADEAEKAVGLAEIEDQPIGSLTTNIRCSEGAVPADMAAAKFGPQPALPADALAARQWPGVLYEWEAPGLCHRPLYFEEENLERYGYTHRRNWIFQPAISGGRFVATVVALPYMMTLRPPCECVYTLGYYRPGSCVPFQARLIELNAKAAVVEAAAVTGLIFAIP